MEEVKFKGNSLTWKRKDIHIKKGSYAAYKNNFIKKGSYAAYKNSFIKKGSYTLIKGVAMLQY